MKGEGKGRILNEVLKGRGIGEELMEIRGRAKGREADGILRSEGKRRKVDEVLKGREIGEELMGVRGEGQDDRSW